MIFDTHVHVYPDHLAAKATSAIGCFYGIPMSEDGCIETLLKKGGAAGIKRYLIHSVATTPHQTSHINDFIASSVQKHPDIFTGFMAMHQDTENIPKEVERAVSLGLSGVKLHPDFQQVSLDDERLYPLYEAIEGRLPLLAHTGDARYHFSNPDQVLHVLKRFPRLTMICAHLGGFSVWEEAVERLSGTGVYVDTSSALFALSPERAADIIRHFGVDHTLFGTDYPMWNASEELERFRSLPLTGDEMNAILWDNAVRLFPR